MISKLKLYQKIYQPDQSAASKSRNVLIFKTFFRYFELLKPKVMRINAKMKTDSPAGIKHEGESRK